MKRVEIIVELGDDPVAYGFWQDDAVMLALAGVIRVSDSTHCMMVSLDRFAAISLVPADCDCECHTDEQFDCEGDCQGRCCECATRERQMEEAD